jgi:selenocysteine lyase/cysteine desulfurase
MVVTDYRADRLRFGFGLYHDEEDVARLCKVLGEILA